MPFCINCGKPLPENANVCPYCATPVNPQFDRTKPLVNAQSSYQNRPAYQQPIYQQDVQQPQAKNNTAKWIAIGAVSALLVVGTVLAVTLINNNRTIEEEIVETDPNDQMCAGDFLYSDLCSRVITENEINNVPPDQLKLLRNEFYARHGMMFSTEELNIYFRAKSWYTPTYPSNKAGFITDQILTPAEKANVIIIRGLERRSNFGYYLRTKSKKDIQHMVSDGGCYIYDWNERFGKDNTAELIINIAASGQNIDLSDWVREPDGWSIRVRLNEDWAGVDNNYFTIQIDNDCAITSINIY